MSRTRMMVLATAACGFALAAARPAAAQLPATYTWTGGSGGAWLTTGNWTGGTAGRYPGVSTIASGSSGNVKDTAFINNGSTNVGLNMNTAGGLTVGSIGLAGTASLTIGNSSGATSGILQLNGSVATTGEGVPYFIQNDSTAGNLTIADVNAGSNPVTMGLRLGNGFGIIRTNTGRTTTISSIISQVSTAQIQVGDTSATGILALSGTNTFTGGVQVNFGPVVAGSGTSGNAAVTISNVAGLGTGTFSVATTALTNTRVLDLNVNGTVANAVSLPTSGPTRLGIQTNGTATAVTLSGKISGGFSGFTLFLDSGTSGSASVLALSNTTNDFVGTVQMNRGVIAITGNGSFGNAANGLIFDQTSNSGGLRFDANNITIAAARAVEFRSRFDINVNNFAATIASNITGTDVGTGYNIKTGASAGSLTLTGNNTTQALLIVNNLTKLIVGSTTALGGITGTTTVSSGGTLGFNSIGTYANAESLTLNGIGVAGVGAIENIAGTNTFSGPVTLGSSSFVGATAGQLTLGGVVSGATFGLTKVGAGTLVLAGANTYTGPTAVNAGVLSVGTFPNGGAAGPLGQSPAAVANLVLNGGTLLYTGGSATSDRGFAATGGTIDISTGGTELTLTGGSAGSGGFTKAGPGTLTLTGATANAGTNTVSAGTLSVGNGASGGTVTGDIVNTAAVVFNRSDASTYAGSLSGSGTVTKLGAGELTLSGANTYTGTTSVSVGSVLVTGSLGTTATTVASGATLRGTGTLNGTTSVSGGGILAPGTAVAVGTLTSSANVSVAMTGNFDVRVGAAGVNDRLVLTGAGTQLNFVTGSKIRFTNAGGFDNTVFAQYPIASLADGDNLRIDGATVLAGYIGEYKAGDQQYGPIAVEVSGFTLNAGDRFILAREGNDLLLQFVPTPEPVFVIGLAVVGLAVGRRVRRSSVVR